MVDEYGPWLPAYSSFSIMFSKAFLSPGCFHLGVCGKGLSTGVTNSLPNDRSLEWSKLTAFENDKIKELKKMIFVFERVENIVGKGENAGYQHFPLFRQCFSKGLLLKVTQSWGCVVKN